MIELSHLLSGYLPHLPVYIVWTIGIALALRGWQQRPRTSRYACLGLTLMFLVSLVMTGLYRVLPDLLSHRLNMNYESVGVILLAGALLQSFLMAIAWLLLLVALFGSPETPTAEVLDRFRLDEEPLVLEGTPGPADDRARTRRPLA